MAFLISCFSFRLCRYLSFPGLLILRIFSPPLFMVLHPCSSSASLSFVSTILWLVFPFTFIPQYPAGDPVDLSCIYFCSARASDSQARGVMCSVDAAPLISQISAFHLLVQLHLLLSPAIIAVCTAQGQQPQDCIGFPFAVS